jgi:TatD DNase family protein
MVYSDSHCHLDSYPEQELKEVLAQMKFGQVGLSLTVSINLDTSQEAVGLAEQYENIYAAVGIHPGEAVPLTLEMRRQLGELITKPHVKAVGEIGLDLLRGREKLEMQKELFSYQVSLAKQAGLPIDIHYSQDAHQLILDLLRRQKDKGLKGIVHGFNGDLKMLRDWLGLDFYISIGSASLGMMISLHNLPPVKDEVIKAIPSERLLTETDSMARMSVSRWKHMQGGPPPDPSAGSGKEVFLQPTDVIEVVRKVAQIKRVRPEDLGRITTENFKKVLNIK